MFVRVLNKGSAQPSSVQGRRCRLKSVCWGTEQGQDPAYFRAGTEKWPQESVLWDPIRGRPRLVQCSDREVVSGVCVGSSKQGQDQDSFNAVTEMWAQAHSPMASASAWPSLIQGSPR